MGALSTSVKTGNARPQAAPAGTGGLWDGPEVLSAYGTSASALVIQTAECPVVAYQQGAADLCATYGIASAVHAFGHASDCIVRPLKARTQSVRLAAALSPLRRVF